MAIRKKSAGVVNNTPSGIPVDASGGPTIDPTANVIALSEASNRRQDDLRLAHRELFDTQNANLKAQLILWGDHQKALSDLRERHQEKLMEAESKRLDAIRQIDRETQERTAAQILNAVTTLAAQNATTAETLRTQVATTAAAANSTFQTTNAEFNKRVSALELSSSEGRGKQALADPQMLEMAAEMRLLSSKLASGGGKTEGYEKLIGWVVGAAAVAYAIFSR